MKYDMLPPLVLTFLTICADPALPTLLTDKVTSSAGDAPPIKLPAIVTTSLRA